MNKVDHLEPKYLSFNGVISWPQNVTSGVPREAFSALFFSSSMIIQCVLQRDDTAIQRRAVRI